MSYSARNHALAQQLRAKALSYFFIELWGCKSKQLHLLSIEGFVELASDLICWTFAESLIQHSRQEAAGVQDGANRYAEQTLGELEVRLKEMAQVVMAGRQELSKIQTIRSAASAVNGDDSKTVSISRAHRAASRLRSMRGNG